MAIYNKTLPRVSPTKSKRLRNEAQLANMKGQLAELRSFARYQQDLIKLTPRGREIVRRFNRIQREVHCPHNPSHLLRVATEFLSTKADGAIAEAGCFKGGSTAKLSIIAQESRRKLIAFDSFEGLPPNTELHEKTINGESIDGWFVQGEFAGSLEEVVGNVSEYGEIEACEFIKGWFEDTMPHFTAPLAAVFLDVDLAESTRACLKYLYPLLQPGGVLISQDGDFPLVLDVFRDDKFWENEVGVERPPVAGLDQDKLLVVRK